MSDIPPPANNDDDIEPSSEELQALLEKLRLEHRRVDQEIEALLETN